MTRIDIERGDFRKNEDDGSSMFEGILYQLGIPKDYYDDVDRVTITADGFDAYDNNGDNLKLST